MFTQEWLSNTYFRRLIGGLEAAVNLIFDSAYRLTPARFAADLWATAASFNAAAALPTFKLPSPAFASVADLSPFPVPCASPVLECSDGFTHQAPNPSPRLGSYRSLVVASLSLSKPPVAI